MCVARVERSGGGNQDPIMGLATAALEVSEQKAQHGGERLMGRGKARVKRLVKLPPGHCRLGQHHFPPSGAGSMA